MLAKLLLEKPDILLLDEPTNYLDEEHIAWLKRYLLDYENAFILISHDIPFLNEVVNIIYHMENQELNRYVGDYEHFQEVYAVKKAQLEAAYRRQQQEISELKDFVARNKARVSTRNMAMSRQKKLDKMDVIELAAEKPKPEFHFRYGKTPGKFLFETHDLVTGYDEPLSKPIKPEHGAWTEDCSCGNQWYRKDNAFKKYSGTHSISVRNMRTGRKIWKSDILNKK